MNFQTEYEILKSIDSDKTLEIAFNFQKHRLKVYFTMRDGNEFLVLICENDKNVFVKNYGVFIDNGIAKIDGYWGIYYKYAKDLSNENKSNFNEFFEKLKQAIRSVNSPPNEFTISYIPFMEGIQKIKHATMKSDFPKEAIYFNHVRRTPMSDIQFYKVSKSLGREIATYLKRSKLTAVFTPDITKQKTFILPQGEFQKI